MREFGKWAIRLGLGFLVFIIALSGILWVTGNGYLLKGVRATYLRGETSATFDDKTYFHQRDIRAINPQPLPFSKRSFSLPERMQKLLDETETTAFLIVQNDSILFEYYPETSVDFRSNSFSMAKTVLTLLAQIGTQDGVIEWNQGIRTLLPEVTGPYAKQLQFWHLSTMTAGLDWQEKYKSPFSITAKAYYGNDVRSTIFGQQIIEKPGERYEYSSGVSQIFGLALAKAYGKSLAEVLEEKLWGPLGMEYDASWHLDKEDGDELAYCCLNAVARDFVKLGMLVNNKGKWKGRTIIASGFFDMPLKRTWDQNYGWSFWLKQHPPFDIMYFRGVWGQFIVPIPEKNAVIVRLGKKHLEKSDDVHPDDIEKYLKFALEYL
ncbi:MAG: class C beta-lactamase-related serine hydrolase [Flavobacteriales bacterium]|nr:MAG: class C beta-lactamase-related serine hydrolase [Flavobacteriales bacterium]